MIAGRVEGGAVRLDGRSWALLALISLGVWIAAYAMLNLSWFTPPAEHPAERALRRVVTCTAGFLLCLAMVPSLARAGSLPVARRIGVAIAVSLAAHAIHLGVRLAVFHLVDPVWGPLSTEVVAEAVRGSGWMFPLCAGLFLVVIAEARARQATPGGGERGGDPAEDHHLWCFQGRRRVRVPVDEVVLFAAEGDYVAVHTGTARYLLRARMKDLAAALPQDRFMRVHRSAIVRLDAVAGLERAGSIWRVRLPGGLEASVSRDKGRQVRERCAGFGIALGRPVDEAPLSKAA